MYKRATSILILVNGMLLLAFFCMKGLWAMQPLEELCETRSFGNYAEAAQRETADASEFSAQTKEAETKSESNVKPESESNSEPEIVSCHMLGIANVNASGQRIVDVQTIEKTGKETEYQLEQEEIEVLRRIVEAEAGGEDEDGRLLVANVVLNRVNHESFPDTVSEVVYQRYKGVSQFSPVASGRIGRVEVSTETIEAVERALEGEDISQGALYFVSRRYADSGKMRWFDENLTFLFEYGGHEFFK